MLTGITLALWVICLVWLGMLITIVVISTYKAEVEADRGRERRDHNTTC